MAINKNTFVNDMILWIENNLGERLDINTIAKKIRLQQIPYSKNV